MEIEHYEHDGPDGVRIDNQNDTKRPDPATVCKKIGERPWRLGIYRKENWGNWLHRMSPYVGKTTPSMAHWLLRFSAAEGDVVLDPFCGVGTIPLEADFLGRRSIGVDLNPYGFCITRAKFNRHDPDELVNWLEEVELDLDNVSTSAVSDFVRQYYDPQTLKEWLALREEVLREKQDFILGCLLGILHGHRPGHLSAITSLVIPYPPKSEPEYREVIPRVISKVRRTSQDGYPLKSRGRAILGDSRKLVIQDDSVDLILSSPPYFDTLDYVQDNRLRLEFLGFDQDGRASLKSEFLQNRKSYLSEMDKAGKEMLRVLKPGSLCVLILGDLHTGRSVVRTAERISERYQALGFETLGIVEDPMPEKKAVPSIHKRKKMDRILVMCNTS